MRNLRALDGARAVAILGVLAGHLKIPYCGGGWLGVDLFFVLSGFLITTLLLREQAETGSISLPRFLARRALRLYPALLFMLAAGWFVAPALSPDGSSSGYLRVAAIVGTYSTDLAILGTGNSFFGGLTHTWSLSVEEHFYLLWPVIVMVSLRRGRSVLRWALIGAVACLFLLGWSLFQAHTPVHRTPQPYFFPFTRGYELLLGCALAACRRGRSMPGWAAGAGLLGLGLIAWTAHDGFSSLLFGQIALGGVISCVIVASLVSSPSSCTARLLSTGPAVWVGRISYGIYLWHPPVILVTAYALPQHRVLAAAVAAGVTIGAAALSHRYVERPFLAIKDTLRPSGSASLSRRVQQEERPDVV